MEDIEIILPILLVLGMFFLVFWFRRKFLNRIRTGEEYRGNELGLDQLTGLKGKLSAEEYKKVCEAIVKKMGEGHEPEAPAKKEVSLADLEAEIRQVQLNNTAKKEQPE